MEFYRYEISTYVSMSDYGYGTDYLSYNRLNLITLNLHKETPKGYWIGYGDKTGLFSTSKWVSKTGKKRYAYPTKEEALVNFTKRTERRMGILNSQISKCRDGLHMAKKELETLNTLKNEQQQSII